MKTRLTADQLQKIQSAVRQALDGQLARYGLTCGEAEWLAARDEIRALREIVYSGKLPHMLAEGPPVDADDERAHHFVARRDGVAVAALRLLPPPFEAAAIFTDLATALRPGGHYIELGRLVGNPGAGEVGAARVLALHALDWGLHQTAYDGLLAYARERASNHFRLLGMEVALRVDSAPGKAEQPYVLLRAHLENTLNVLPTWG
ncbi:MAG: hypothetical protein JWM80_2601 [Cyanobacteria bacterium RYN_339]|nr:hypothetical protein [Cyanobacteria bacterium RYN_339]